MSTKEALYESKELTMVRPNHPLLRESALAVQPEEISSPEVQGLIDGMLELSAGEQGDLDKPFMVGLAAPQLGINKRIVIAAVGEVDFDGKTAALEAFINPVIIWSSEEANRDYEGCYSLPRNMFGVVKRADKVKMVFYDREGLSHTKVFEGFAARVLQHETDHLEGRVFFDRIEEPRDLHRVDPEDTANYRDNWQDWDKLYNPEDFLAIRNAPYKY